MTIAIERKQTAGVISASRVRELLARDALSLRADHLPASTLAFLLSHEAEPLRKQLQLELQRLGGC